MSVQFKVVRERVNAPTAAHTKPAIQHPKVKYTFGAPSVEENAVYEAEVRLLDKLNELMYAGQMVGTRENARREMMLHRYFQITLPELDRLASINLLIPSHEPPLMAIAPLKPYVKPDPKAKTSMAAQTAAAAAPKPSTPLAPPSSPDLNAFGLNANAAAIPPAPLPAAAAEPSAAEEAAAMRADAIYAATKMTTLEYCLVLKAKFPPNRNQEQQESQQRVLPPLHPVPQQTAVLPPISRVPVRFQHRHHLTPIVNKAAKHGAAVATK